MCVSPCGLARDRGRPARPLLREPRGTRSNPLLLKRSAPKRNRSCAHAKVTPPRLALLSSRRAGVPRGKFPIKKLTCSDRATNSSCWRCHKRGSGGERLEFDGVSEVCQAFDQACFLPVCGTTIEVIGAEILIHRAVLEHVVDGGEDGGGDCDNGLLGTPPGFNAVVQGPAGSYL